MANKTIPELPEIDVEDVDDDDLVILETAVQTYKFRLSSLLAFVRGEGRTIVNVSFDGSETGDKTVDVGDGIDATKMIWMLRKPDKTQIPGQAIQATAVDTVVIPTGDFPYTVGTYTLVGV